jgi:hypothetical protein
MNIFPYHKRRKISQKLAEDGQRKTKAGPRKARKPRKRPCILKDTELTSYRFPPFFHSYTSIHLHLSPCRCFFLVIFENPVTPMVEDRSIEALSCSSCPFVSSSCSSCAAFVFLWLQLCRPLIFVTRFCLHYFLSPRICTDIIPAVFDRTQFWRTRLFEQEKK